jgi:hypothetical protein
MDLRNKRTCGSCTACCDGWLQIEVRGHQVRPGKPCPFSVEHRCSIYSERPQHPCREFVCGWLIASSPLPEWMRPDRSDMIMLAANFAWYGLPVDVLVAAGDRPRKKALDWLMKFRCREQAAADLSDGRRVVRLRSAGVSGRDFGTHRARRKAVGGLIAEAPPTGSYRNQRLNLLAAGAQGPELELSLSPRQLKKIRRLHPEAYQTGT